ncbi:MAG TPA: hypothetical protein VGE67_01240, partial [Haloferula sp.]
MKEDRLDLLLHALFEESLGEVERVELNDLLVADPEARARYRRVAGIHSALARKTASQSFFEAPATLEPKVVALPKRWWSIAAVASFAIMASGISLMALRPRGPVANVLETQGVAWVEGSAAPTSGRLPVAVPLEFTRGFVRLGFPSGAKVTLEAPCRFRL